MDMEDAPRTDAPVTPVCAVGASAGGVAALQKFFERVPTDLGLAYVVIVHLSPDHPSQLAAILANVTDMPVGQVDDSPRLLPNHVYVIPPDRALAIQGDDIAATPFDEPRGRRAPIDMFFRSVAEARGDGVAVVLTGAGSDGSIGVRAIKERGGVVFAQDPREAEYAMMPRSAIATGAVDFVAEIDKLVERLVEVTRSKKALSTLGENEAATGLRRILGFLRARTGHEFSGYKRATVMRRVMRRMQVNRRTSLEDYATCLREEPEEAQELFRDLLISVTQFFRDPAAFERLQQEAIRPILAAAAEDDVARVWAVGCATGEEAYSLAILVLEESDRLKVAPKVQIFASDLDEGALAAAREGRFPRSIEADVSEERLRRFFAEEGPHYRIRKEVRDLVLFASHSVLKDPPFMRLDLIVCRNLMIYLERDLQRQVCSLFHYALKPGGRLFLGSAETADAAADLFSTVDREARLYQARMRADASMPQLPQIVAEQGFDASRSRPTKGPHPAREGGLGAVHAGALERRSPPSALVDDAHRILHLSPEAGRYLRLAEGPFTSDLSALVRPELRVDLKIALQRAFEHREPTLSLPIIVELEGRRRRVVIHATPAEADERAPAQALVFFLDGGSASPSDGAVEGGSDEVRRLHEELRVAHERLAASRREHQQATQELRAANEELQSINEEYRSTSEELETSKEELQSINEELQTVNAELKSKLESISTAHSDLRNLIAATDIGTLFLDAQLRIKLFTPAVARLFNITESDAGRAITHFTHNLDYDDLVADAERVVRELVPLERELRTEEDRWLMMRMRPYRTIEDRINGVVITFVDITERRDGAARLRETQELLSMSMRASRLGWGTWDFTTGIAAWDARARELIGLGEGEDRLENWFARVHADDRARFDRTLAEGRSKGEFDGLEYRVVHRDGAVRHLHASGVLRRGGESGTIQGAGLVRDVTERKDWEERQRLLVGELNHRVKNMLAVVQSIARQTQRTTVTSEAFVAAFERRMQALARAHDLLTRRSWSGADLRELMEGALAIFAADGDDRVEVEGREKVTVAPNAAISLIMALHELGTNAMKHGALSSPEGRVRVAWAVDAPNLARRSIRLSWTERDGPAVKPPTRSGFGSRMLERGIARELGGAVRVDYLPDGLVCEMEFPLDGQFDLR